MRPLSMKDTDETGMMLDKAKVLLIHSLSKREPQIKGSGHDRIYCLNVSREIRGFRIEDSEG